MDATETALVAEVERVGHRLNRRRRIGDLGGLAEATAHPREAADGLDELNELAFGKLDD